MFYNGEGFTDRNILQQKDFLNFFAQNKGFYSLNHSLVYAAVFFTWSQLFYKTTSLSFNLAFNAIDFSLLFSHIFTFSLVDNFSLSLTPSLFFGEKQTEFTTHGLAGTIALDINLLF